MKELDEAFELLHRDARETPGDLAGARARLMDELDGVTPLRRRRRWVLPAAAAAVVLLAAGTVGVVVTRQRTLTVATASEVLLRAADSIDVGAVEPKAGPGQYLLRVEHVRSSRSNAENPDGSVGYTYLLEQEISRWIPANDRDVWQETRKVLGSPRLIGQNLPDGRIPPMGFQPTDDGQWAGACGDFFPQAQPKKVCGDPTDWDSPEFYARLPRDPDELYGRLKELTANRGSAPDTVFHHAVQILATGMMPADLRAQWYRAIAKIPGIQIAAQATTVDGRDGVALGLTTEHEQRQLIIDPATGEFIGERTVAGVRPYQAWIRPGVETYSSSITTSVVNGRGQTR
ncbi:hypothetical protein SAMN04488564_109177 [Lentzea waywayandensis]|uniref:CU044_5270 family protein n=1 Tax=Lentzea waywayandensis TaxID=84724 RepID=A0A1I6F897_9PSEU|nr:CU044_5270 family protein [Lentzea waywayandensis]SFR26007.1 hypothetical protein SAMN04488564_109177 [Lentzea waywayandensis]